ncbi:MAG: PAS domain S-box protein, partial [Opitutaceae bacterium]
MGAVRKDEAGQLRSAALQTSAAILVARERAERDLVEATGALERKTQELAQSLAMMRATLESTTDGILVTDVMGRVTGFNEKLVQLWSLPRELLETTHQQVQEVIGGQVIDRSRHDQVLADIYTSWPPETFDLLELSGGRVIERYSKIQLIDGRAAGRVWSYREITDRKAAERELREQREWFEVTLSSIGDAVITTDTEARISYLNPVAEQMTGWKLTDAKGRPLEEVFQIVNESTGAPAANPITKVLREGIVVGLANHTALVARDGTKTPIEDSAAPIRGAAGKISGAVMVFHDVTRRRQAEEALRDNEQRLSAIFNQATVGMATAGLDGRFDQVNQRLGDILGYRADELVGRTFRELTFPEDLPATEIAVRRLLAGEISDYAIEKRYVRKGGGVVWSLTTVTLIKAESGQALRFVGVVEDITLRRQAEEALQARERELSLIYNSVSDSIFFLAAEPAGEFRFVTVNPAFLSATGLLESQVVGKRLSEVIPEPSLSLVLGHYQEAIRTKQIVRWEETTTYPSGRKTGAVSVTPIFDSNGKCINLIGTVHDVSQRRHTEEVTARLAAVVESSDDAIVSKTLEGVIVTWNKGAEQMFGYTVAEAVGQPIKMLIPPNRIDEEPEILRRIRQGERVEHYETVRQRKDGTLFDVSVTISPIRDPRGTIIGASKIARNITAQKQTEEILRESEARYRIMGQVVPHLLWVTDAQGIPTYFNDRWYAYTGHHESLTSATERRSALHPDDQRATTESWMHAVKTGEPFECEYRIRRFDGAYRWFVGRGVPLRDEAGKILRWYGSSTDVHEQKVTAEALREQYIVTEQLNGVARALATELDLSKIVQIITDAGTRITRAQFGAFFHNQIDENGESYMLYALSGAPREAFAKFPMPRATEIFGPTFRGEGVI